MIKKICQTLLMLAAVLILNFFPELEWLYWSLIIIFLTSIWFPTKKNKRET